uniref:NR LBD domain-containing protein n=1 Tax=Meloidogyne enterolobii TaxID=390850 RepID=A0A6V7UJP2_MELEN|nr:unnamed protein product [Meloidogyne enterolobii]
MFKMLNSSVYEFDELEEHEKNQLVDACFHQFNFLNCLILTMRTYPLECYYSVNNFVLAYGHIFDSGIKEKIITYWVKDSEDKDECFKKFIDEMDELIHLIKQFLEFSDYKINLEDCCALMAITLCNKYSSLTSSIGELIWDRLREAILREWLQQLTKSIGSEKEASTVLVYLISALVNLENYCHTKKNISNNQSLKMVGINKFTECKLSIILPSLIRILKAHNRIWGAFYELPESYVKKFSSFNHILTSADNILGYHEKFNPNPQPMKDTERQAFFISLSRLHCPIDHPHISKSITVCRLLVIGIFKALPLFQRLSRNDQEILINKQIKIVGILLKCFNAIRLKSTTLIGTDGLTSIDILSAQPKFRENKHLMHLAEKAYCKVVEPFLQMVPVIEEDEFSILMAILCASGYTSSHLSKHARILLQTESELYAKMLLNHCQIRFGDAEGASRFAKCMHLIECAHIFNRNNDLFNTYMEAFYQQRITKQIPEYLVKVV